LVCWCRATRAPQSIGKKSMLDLRFYWRPNLLASCASATVAIVFHPTGRV
jgi:hypothetical protein